MRRAQSSRIAADIELEEITISLSRFGPPKVSLKGSLRDTADRRVSRGGATAVIETIHLPPAGEAFISEMKAAFQKVSNEH